MKLYPHRHAYEDVTSFHDTFTKSQIVPMLWADKSGTTAPSLNVAAAPCWPGCSKIVRTQPCLTTSDDTLSSQPEGVSDCSWLTFNDVPLQSAALYRMAHSLVIDAGQLKQLKCLYNYVDNKHFCLFCILTNYFLMLKISQNNGL